MSGRNYWSTCRRYGNLAVSLVAAGCAGAGAVGATPTAAQQIETIRESLDEVESFDESTRELLQAQLDSVEMEQLLGDTDGDPLSSYLDSLPRATEVEDYDTFPDAVAWQLYFDQALENVLGVFAQAIDLGARNEDVLLPADQASEIRASVLRATRKVDPKKLEVMLARPYVIGAQEIPVVYDAAANANIALAKCTKGGKRQIVLATKPNPRYRMNTYAMLFVREHEFSHHLRGHIVCENGRTRRTTAQSDELQQQELEADCDAARSLYTFPAGQRVVDRAWSVLHGFPAPSSSHPPGTRRSEHIDQCTEGLVAIP